jgi:DNA-binding XRE family transcriptional regulator
MATAKDRTETSEPQFENRLREKRQALGLSQKQLANAANITRQAVAAVESNQYSPATSVALQLARALRCRVEDLFSIKSEGEIIDGELLGSVSRGADKKRARVTQVGERWLVRPLDGAGELTSLTASADGLIVGADSQAKGVKVQLLRQRETVRRQIAIGGCDPAMLLAAEHRPARQGESRAQHDGQRYRPRRAQTQRVSCRGNPSSRGQLGRLEASQLETLSRHMDFIVVTFAHWEEGFIVQAGNPKNIRAVADLAKPTVKIVNREKGSVCARRLSRQATGRKRHETNRVKDTAMKSCRTWRSRRGSEQAWPTPVSACVPPRPYPV